VERTPGVAVGDDTVKTDLVKVGCLKLQHLVDTSPVYLICSLANLLIVALTTKAGSNQLLAVLVQQVECWLVSTG
jgi:hypothetical protein